MKVDKNSVGAGRARTAATSSATNDEEILSVLRSANTPMTAYAILDAVRGKRIAAPTTVYRALSRLTRGGVVHRLESINSYVACCDQQHHHDPNVFAICLDCGHVDELREIDVVQRLQAYAAHLGFQVKAATIELTGRCASCAKS
jgi:Fur family transcriptional regulator, zinc uptake regulator